MVILMSSDPLTQQIFSKDDNKHGLSLFNHDEINQINDLIVEREGKFVIKCQIKDRYKIAKPEEIVRQLWIKRLIEEYGYPKNQIDVERLVYFGSRDSGLADIVVLHEDLIHPYLIIEVKRPKRKDGLEQLKSYCNAEGAPIGIWSNGNEIIRLHREEPNIFVEIPRVPNFNESLRDVLTERWTISWLEENDELKKGNTTLKKIILDLEELVLGNSGEEAFDEIFKLIYAKLYDEWKGINNPEYQLNFFVGDRSSIEVSDELNRLLNGAKRQWSGVFEPSEQIALENEHLKVCVSFLEKIKLFNSNLRIIDEAFEYLIPKVAKEEKGQYFTPRIVEDMVVKMLNPKTEEFLIDPACGSAGFLLHSIMWIAGGVITASGLPTAAKNFAQNNIVGIDISKVAVKVSKAINLIVGDGKSQIYKANSLNPQSWSAEAESGLRPRLLDPDDDTFINFDFDVLMTNPPFSGTIKERDILRQYRLAEKSDGKIANSRGRHILFLNRSLQLVAPKGRIAIIIPQSLVSNTSTEFIRDYVIDEARILAVVGLHVNTFKPHTGTKTSVLFLQKYTDEEKAEIQRIKLKYAEEFEEFVINLKEEYSGIKWDTEIDETSLNTDLKEFIENYYDVPEDLNEINLTDVETAIDEENEDLNTLIFVFNQLNELLSEKQDALDIATSRESKAEIKKEITTFKNKIASLKKKISKKTLGGQVYLTLNLKDFRERFGKFWITKNVRIEMDYPIFGAVNQIPIKYNNGEYRYKRNEDGSFVLDEHNHIIIEHDLDDIASAFIEFAKEQNFDFWEE